MRLKRLYLKNYANIFNALGRYEIDIDFTKCKNSILVIRSENGSGKSSLINELHPFFSNSNVWIPDVPIIKQIEFLLDDGTILSILYNGYLAKETKPKQARCYIKRIYPDGNIIELNPNGNITSGKDIISSLLDINDDYILLSSLSANSKGIGAMKPSERKKFLSLIISSLDPYAKLYKMVTQKYSVLKAMIQSLTIKISQLGNIELIQAEIKRNKKELNLLENKRNNIIEQKANLTASINILLKDGNPIDIYNSYLKTQIELKQIISGIPENIINFNENILSELNLNYAKLESKFEILSNQLNEIVSKEQVLRDELDNYNIKLKTLFDKNVLNDLENRLDNSKKQLEIYKKYFESLGFKAYENITEQEYSIAIDAMEKFNQTVLTIGNSYLDEIIREAIKYINKEYKIIHYEEIITNYKKKIELIKNKINEQKNLQIKAKDYSEIPKDCNHINDCPFINTIVKSKNLILSDKDYNQLISELDELIKNLDMSEKLMIKQNNVIKCISDIKFIYNYMISMKTLLKKFPNTNVIDSSQHILHCIQNSIRINLNLDLYKEYTNYISLISNCKNDILSYEEKIKTMTNSSKESWKLQQTIELKNNELQNLINKKLQILVNYNEIKKNKEHLELEIELTQNNMKLKNTYNDTIKKLDEVNDHIKELHDSAVKYNEYTNTLVKLKEEENNLTLSLIPQVKNIIDKSNYQMILYDQYKQEYTYYSELFDKLEIVKQNTSIHGIQADIMDIQMSQMINLINQLAAMMFGSRFLLQKFEINADNFNIPVFDKETEETRPDISFMSNSQLSQLSMIISFVLLYNASKNYNIIRLDEIDNNLDNDNRFQFFNLVNLIMDILHFDQCIMISHNYELDLTNCDLIITRIQNTEIYNSILHSGANIIANFMEKQ